ncbi:FKBP-type peptidyl-prolyl cis-trans isomerase [Halotalea alkalilenta]|uniref:FKBP-type peptidyl-prolyl cis-trans isomerase n=1 Tax=Halotalea alkalilenta TaxID=376489 RepID=UPI0004891683|nr:FKBP-type peptidyl-prolyl cis-trans isomerase [Halotalea alkalilenta]
MSGIEHDLTRIGEGTSVVLHFTLMLEDGTVVDSTRDGRPAEFDFGDGNLPPGFEQPLRGLGSGESGRFEVIPEHAFGQYNPQNVQMLDRSAFDASIELETGTVVSFSEPGGGELPGVIKTVEGDRIEVDFNHPLAGRTLLFDVEVLEVRPLTTH